MCWARGSRGYFAYWGSEPILKAVAVLTIRRKEGEIRKWLESKRFREVWCCYSPIDFFTSKAPALATNSRH